MMNRLANCHNPYQGKKRKVLVCCSAGLLRSPTIAYILGNPPYNCNTRAAGVSTEYALIVVDKVLVEWADEIVCANEEQVPIMRNYVKHSGKPKKKITCLDIPDNYDAFNPELMEIIQNKLNAIGFASEDIG
jgi:predicted protein tyrosine phosphatase